MKNNKILVNVLLLSILLGTVSCSSGQQYDNVQQVSVKPYGIARELSLGLSEEALSGCFVTDQYIYYIQEKKDTGGSLIRRELTAQAKPMQLFTLETNEVLHAYTVTEAGEVIAAVKCFGTTNDNEVDWNSYASMELRKTDERGELQWRREIPDSQGIPFISHVLAGNDGRIYASSQTELFCFNETGKLTKRLAVKGELIQQLADAGEGKVAVLQYTRNGQNLTIYQGADGKEVFHKDFQEDKAWFQEPKGLYYPEVDLLMRYHWEDDSRQPVLNFTGCGIDISAIRIFRSLGEESFLAGLKEEGSSVIRFVWLDTQAPRGQEKEAHSEEDKPKTKLTLAAFNAQNLQNSVVSFNKRNQNYELTLKAFDFLSQREQFYAYLAAKEGPDIVEISGRLGNYIRAGYLLDLTELIEKSEKTNRDDFLSRVWEDIAVDGRLYTIPKAISISALACPAELLEGKTSWTIEEYLDLLEKYPNAMSEEGDSVADVKYHMLRTALCNGIRGFVDKEEGKAYLDSEEFRSILERIAALDVLVIDESRGERAREGEPVFWTLSFRTTGELQQAEGISGQELTLIGYPVSGRIEGERSSNIISYDHMMGIHSGTENVEAAWEYVENYYTGALGTHDFFFTTGKAAFEEKLQEYTETEYFTLENMEPAIYPPATELQVEKVRNAFLEGTYIEDEEFDIIDIIMEEAMPYFKGDKGLDDVVKIIQNRVQLYLDERG